VIFVLYQDADGAAERPRVSHAGKKGAAVGFDEHAAPAAVPLLATGEIDIYVRAGEAKARGHPFQDADLAGSVRFAGCGEP
jgi:hypothetical protein